MSGSQALLAVLLLSVGLAAAGCSETPPATEGVQGSAERSLDEAAEETEREADEIDAQFRQSPLGSVVTDLPIGRPPLPVRQYIVRGDDELVARLPAKDFFCGRTPEERRAAVASFYEDARRRFREEGMDDVDLTVASLTGSLDEIAPLARVRDGGASLTSRGRARGRC